MKHLFIFGCWQNRKPITFCYLNPLPGQPQSHTPPYSKAGACNQGQTVFWCRHDPHCLSSELVSSVQFTIITKKTCFNYVHAISFIFKFFDLSNIFKLLCWRFTACIKSFKFCDFMKFCQLRKFQNSWQSIIVNWSSRFQDYETLAVKTKASFQNQHSQLGNFDK